MKRFTLEKRKYSLWDYLRIPFQISPFMILLIMITAVLLSLEPTLVAFTTALFVDTATAIFNGQKSYDAIIWPLIFVLMVVAFNWVQRNITHFCWVRFRLRTTDHFMTALSEKKARLDYRHIENAESWDLIKRVCGGELASGVTKYEPVEQIVMGYCAIQNMIIACTRIAGLMTVFISFAWWTALVVVVLSLPLFIVSLVNGKKNYGAKKKGQIDTRRVEYLGDVLRSRDYAEERSLFGYSDRVGEMFEKHHNIAVAEQAAAQKKSLFRSSAASLCSVAIWFIIALVLLPSVGGGAISLGMYIALIGSVTDIVNSMSGRLAGAAEDIADKREYIRDLETFANLSETPGAMDRPAAAPAGIQEIRFENVRFAYPGTNKYILDGVNLVIREGVKYAFVGANGAGKTTIIKLLTGLYTNYEGRILINGKELREYSTAEQKAFFAVVHQDFARYSISIRDNIALGNVNAMEDGSAEERVSAAVEATGLTSEIGNLKQGLNTELGKLHRQGHDLSGGQWQRIAIARATVSDAPVVVLDEPTAALDPLAESNLYSEFGRISRDKTSIFISHRLGSTKLADWIYVFENGKVQEYGSHTALMAEGGLYAEMYDAQKEWYL